jgi:hypothetical protein
MIEIGGNITIGGQIVIGLVSLEINDFITEDSNFLVSETDQNFIEEQ